MADWRTVHVLTAPVQLQEEVEKTLLSLCRSVLKKDEIDLNKSFVELGGDSLSQLHFIAAIFSEFEVGLTTEALLEAKTLKDVRTLVIRALVEERAAFSQNRNEDKAKNPFARLRRMLIPEQETITGPVRLLANRYSYFLRRKRNLEFWNTTTGILKTRSPLDENAFREAVSRLVEHHDGLRLQAECINDDWRQFIVSPGEANPIVIENYSGSDHKTFVETAAQQILESFTFPGDLFKVLLLISSRSETLFMVAAHHLLLDAYSFGLVLRDLADLYTRIKADGVAGLPNKTTSFMNYSLYSTEFWLLQEQEELSYWRSLPWSRIERLRPDKPVHELSNREQYTRHVMTSVTSKGDRSTGYNIYTKIDTLLCAIATAYCKWTGHRLLHLALVFHGRESFLEGVDLTRTAGWISETVPLLLDPHLNLADFLADTHRQVEQAGVRGKSYGVLKYFSEKESVRREMAAHPSPEVSLNIIQPEMLYSDLSSFADRLDHFNLGPENRATTERAFLLSGGVHFRDGAIDISWDFSDQLFNEESIRQFTNACAREHESLTNLLRPRNIS